MSPSRRPWRGVLAALTLAGSLTLTACVPGSNGAPPTPTADSSPAPGTSLAAGGIVRLPVTALPTQLNPWTAGGQDANAATLRGPLSSPAFTYDASGVARPNPAFISDVTVNDSDATPRATASPDEPTVVTLSLNPDAVWGDGSPITAADWIATFRALHGANSYTVTDRHGWDRVKSVRQGSDKHTVVVTFTGPEPDWTEPLAPGAMPAAGVADAATFNTGWTLDRTQWFVGPFVVTDIDRARGILTLQPNPRWWGTKPALDTVFVRRVPSEALPATVAAGEFDAYSPGASPVRLAKARTAPDTELGSAPGTTGRILRFGSSGPLADLDVRRALVHAINRGAVADGAEPDAGDAATVWSNAVFLPQQAGYVDMAEATGISYDVDAAVKALTDAGYTLTGREPQGTLGPLRLTVTVPPQDARAAAEASTLIENLTTVGIEASEVPSGGDLTVEDATFTRYPLQSLSERTQGVPGVSAVVAGSGTQTDASLRQGQATQAARMTWLNAGALPLYVVPQTWVVRTRLVNAGPPGFATTSWEGVGYTG